MREVRAVVLGLLVVVLVAMALAYWRRPEREFHRVGGYRVDIQKKEGDEVKRLSFNVGVGTLARIASLVPVREAGFDLRRDWGNGNVSGKDILDAAEQSAPGKPGVIERHGNRIEVTADGEALDIRIKDDWGRRVDVRLPRAVVEGFAGRKSISLEEILKRLDELGPGDVIRVQDGDNLVTISAEPK